MTFECRGITWEFGGILKFLSLLKIPIFILKHSISSRFATNQRMIIDGINGSNTEFHLFNEKIHFEQSES